MSIQKYASALALGLAIFISATTASAQVVSVTKSVKEANVKVFETNYESLADIVVFKTPFISRAQGNEGVWYFTSLWGESSKKICFVPSKEVADIVIYYTTDSKKAGWLNKKKKHFMD
jgi:hypothetical protein